MAAGDWKLLEYYEDHHLELYNLRTDLSEQTNLASQMRDKAEELRTRLHGWLKAVGGRCPPCVEQAIWLPGTNAKAAKAEANPDAILPQSHGSPTSRRKEFAAALVSGNRRGQMNASEASTEARGQS